VLVLVLWISEAVALEYLRVGRVMQEHVHPAERPRCVVHLLAEYREAAGRGVRDLEEQRARAAGRVVDGMVLVGPFVYLQQPRHDARDLGGCVELAFGLPGLGSEVAHQVLVGVAEQVIALGAVGGEVYPGEDADEVGEAVLLLAPTAELVV
jgi:hypothetical protein